MRLAGLLTEPRGLGPHDHVCWFYESPQQFRLVMQRFLLDGLARGERLLCVGEATIASATAHDHRGLPRVADLIRSGRLQMLRLDQAHADDGPERLRFYARAVNRALADGYTGLRMAAEVTDLARDPGRWEDHLRWEHLTDEFINTEPGMAALCAYRTDAVQQTVVAGLSAVHPLAHGPGADVAFRLFFDGGVLALAGEVDAFAAPALSSLLAKTHVGGQLVVLDLARLGFADAAGTRAIATWGRELAGRGSTLQLRDASRTFRRVWSLLDFDGIAEFTERGGAA